MEQFLKSSVNVHFDNLLNRLYHAITYMLFACWFFYFVNLNNDANFIEKILITFFVLKSTVYLYDEYFRDQFERLYNFYFRIDIAQVSPLNAASASDDVKDFSPSNIITESVPTTDRNETENETENENESEKKNLESEIPNKEQERLENDS